MGNCSSFPSPVIDTVILPDAANGDPTTVGSAGLVTHSEQPGSLPTTDVAFRGCEITRRMVRRHTRAMRFQAARLKLRSKPLDGPTVRTLAISHCAFLDFPILNDFLKHLVVPLLRQRSRALESITLASFPYTPFITYQMSQQLFQTYAILDILEAVSLNQQQPEHAFSKLRHFELSIAFPTFRPLGTYISAILVTNPGLRTLKIQSCVREPQNVMIEQMVQGFQTIGEGCLEELNLTRCGILDEELQMLLPALQKHQKSLKNLILSKNDSLTSASLPALAKLLLDTSMVLETLDLFSVHQVFVNSDMNTGLKTFLEALEVSRIRALNIHNCGLHDTGAMQLFDVLTRNKSLRILAMGSNQLGYTTMRALTNKVVNMKTLNHLQIHDLRLVSLDEQDQDGLDQDVWTFEDRAAFHSALTSNTHLLSLSLDRSISSLRSSLMCKRPAHVDRVLIRNYLLKHARQLLAIMGQSKKKIPLGLWSHIVARLQNPPMRQIRQQQWSPVDSEGEDLEGDDNDNNNDSRTQGKPKLSNVSCHAVYFLVKRLIAATWMSAAM